MKKLIFLILITFVSCKAMKPACTLENRWWVVIEYSKSVKVWTVETVDYKCYGSFRTYDNIKIGDTIRVITIEIGNVSNFTPPRVQVIERK